MSYSVHALPEGIFSVGKDKRFFRIGKNDPPAKGALKVALNPFLIQTPDENILIDTGLGSFGEDNHYEIMLQNLEAHGLSEIDISTIYLSHLHYDHTGGLIHTSRGFPELAFPDAEVYLLGKGWERARQTNHPDGPGMEFFDFIEARAQLNFTDEVNGGIKYISTKTIGGHTMYSQLIEIKIKDQLFLMAGDVLASKGAVNRKYVAKYDFDGKKSMELRQQICERAYKEKAIILAYHDTEHPMFMLTDYNPDKGYAITNIEEYNG